MDQNLTLDMDTLEPGLRKMVRAIENKPDLPERLARMALAFRKHHDRNDSCKLALAARSMRPNDELIRVLTDWVIRRHAPQWHFPLVHDELRNQAYSDALQHFVEPGMVVFEIGTGTGLLAMLAARAGAGHVYTCETEPPVAEAARDIIARNGLAERITVIQKNATEIRLGKDLPERADLFVAEIVDNHILAESVLALTEFARAHLLKPGAKLLPHSVSAMGMLVAGEWRKYRMDKVMGFDLSPFNRFSPSMSNAGAGGGQIDALSDVHKLLELDLMQDQPKMTEARNITITTNKPGVMDGMLRWHKLDFGDGIFFENRPPQISAWYPQLHLFQEPRTVKKGEKMRIEIFHDRERIVIQEADICL